MVEAKMGQNGESQNAQLFIKLSALSELVLKILLIKRPFKIRIHGLLQ